MGDIVALVIVLIVALGYVIISNYFAMNTKKLKSLPVPKIYQGNYISRGGDIIFSLGPTYVEFSDYKQLSIKQHMFSNSKFLVICEDNKTVIGITREVYKNRVRGVIVFNLHTGKKVFKGLCTIC